MSSLSRRRRDGWARFFGFKRQSNSSVIPELLASDQFLQAIAKERSRAERRDLTFCVVRIDFKDEAARFPDPHFDRLVTVYRNRLRLTDELGVFQKTLGVLMPETLPGAAALVANELCDIAKSLDYSISTDIFAWPVPDDGMPANWSDDENRSGSFELVLDENANGFGKSGGPDGSTATATRQQSRMSIATQHAIKVQSLDFSMATPFWKRAIDIAGASAGLLILSPVLVAAAISIKCSSPGFVVFRQWREGKDGKLFRIYKLRTMYTGADEQKHIFRELSEQDGPAFKIKNDPRLTRVGTWLRKSCIDELPQLINVLKGEMSLVGPRPLPADESLDCNRWQRRRLDVLPGMTCTWQVSGGRDMPFDNWMRLDLQYVQRCSVWTDLKLLARTFLVTILHRGSV